MPLLRLRDIKREYEVGPTKLTVLGGVDLDVEAGESLAIVGKSGSGKSTLMNIIGLLDQPTSGHYEIAGRHIQGYDDRQLSTARNQMIGFVFQSFHLLPRLTATANVALPLFYRGVPEAERRARALAALERVDLADRAEHRPNELSGGQRQRVAIARALVGEPSLVLADEPTGALDPRVSREIMNLFVELNRDSGITIVMITHNSGVAARCGRTVRIVDGRIEAARAEEMDEPLSA